MANEEKEASKLTSMRLSPEVLERLEYFRQRYGWTPGETLVRLLDYHDRIQNAVELLGQGFGNDGDPIVFVRDSVSKVPHILLGHEQTAFLSWLVAELGKQVPEAFRDMSGYPEELELI